MTPMIDVVFLLLIFFVCASVGQRPESLLPTRLPAGTVEVAEVEREPLPLGEVWVEVSGTGEALSWTVTYKVGPGASSDWSYDEFARLKERLRDLAGAASDIPVTVDPGGDVTLGEVIRLYDGCLAAGFETIRFATEARTDG